MRKGEERRERRGESDGRISYCGSNFDAPMTETIGPTCPITEKK